MSIQVTYISQFKDFTILGVTIWFDQEEQWSQAKVTPIITFDGLSATARFEVQEGYDVAIWRDCNSFYADGYDSLPVDCKRTFTSRITEPVNIKEGYQVTTIACSNLPRTIASDLNGNLQLNGIASNSGLTQYGLTEKVTATFEDVWNVKPPVRLGFAPRVEGSTLSQGHIRLFDFDIGGDPPIGYKSSSWQTTECEMDLQDMSDRNSH